jgi:hypothetical protein
MTAVAASISMLYVAEISYSGAFHAIETWKAMVSDFK